MKNLILLIAVMVLSAYATTSTVKSVTGAYEHKRGEDTFRMVFLENGISERYANGKKEEKEGKWKISEEGELHDTYSNRYIWVYRINKDGSITIIARIDADGKREEAPKDKQMTFKKIK